MKQRKEKKIDNGYNRILCNPTCQCARKSQSPVRYLKLSEGVQREEVTQALT